MKRPRILISLLILMLFIGGLPQHVHGADCYMPCVICNGSAKCGLCDPSKVPDALGDGYMVCIYCHQTGFITCGTNHTGDGTPIGCDGSGKMPDGRTCVVCGGEGKYPCDVCFGTGVFECKCRQAGKPGKCTVCFGTGWWLTDGAGHQTNTSPVYPHDGAVIDAATWGKAERFSYSTALLGSGTTPYEGMARCGAHGTEDFYKVLRSGKPLTGGQEGPLSQDQQGAQGQSQQEHQSGQQSQGGQSQQPGPDQGRQDQSQSSDQSQPEPDQSQVNDPGQPRDDPYDVQTGDADEILRHINEPQSDMIFFLNRRVDGNYLLTVQTLKSQLSEEELAVLNAMTVQDVAEFCDMLKTAANGFEYTNRQWSEDSVDIGFRFGPSKTFPFRCDVLLELPCGPGHAEARLYQEKDFGTVEARISGLDDFEGREYLIFTVQSLGSFRFTSTAQETVPDRPEEPQPPQGTQAAAQEDRPPALQEGSSAGQENSSPPPEDAPAGTQESPDKAQKDNSPLPNYILLLAAGIVIGLGTGLMVSRRKK